MGTSYNIFPEEEVDSFPRCISFILNAVVFRNFTYYNFPKNLFSTKSNVLITEIIAQNCDIPSTFLSYICCIRIQHVRFFTHKKHNEVKLQSVRGIT